MEKASTGLACTALLSSFGFLPTRIRPPRRRSDRSRSGAREIVPSPGPGWALRGGLSSDGTGLAAHDGPAVAVSVMAPQVDEAGPGQQQLRFLPRVVPRMGRVELVVDDEATLVPRQPGDHLAHVSPKGQGKHAACGNVEVQ